MFLECDAVLSDNRDQGLKRIEPSTDLVKLVTGFRTGGCGGGFAGTGEPVEYLFVKNTHVTPEFLELAVHVRPQFGLARFQTVQPSVDDLESLVDRPESLIDRLEPTLEPMVEFGDLVADLVEPLFRHAPLQLRADDDTSSRPWLKEQSTCRTK
jgi:hypothetical protein